MKKDKPSKVIKEKTGTKQSMTPEEYATLNSYDYDMNLFQLNTEIRKELTKMMEVFRTEVLFNKAECDTRFSDVRLLLDRIEQIEDFLQIPYSKRKWQF